MVIYNPDGKTVELEGGEILSLYCGEDLDELSSLIVNYTEGALSLQEFYSMLLKWKLEG